MEWLAFMHQTVGTGLGQPVKLIKTLPNIETRGHLDLSLLVTSTTAPINVEQMAGGTSKEDFTGVLVLKLVETTTTATVAKRLPLGLSKLLQPLMLPEGLVRFRHVSAPGQILIRCPKTLRHPEWIKKN